MDIGHQFWEQLFVTPVFLEGQFIFMVSLSADYTPSNKFWLSLSGVAGDSQLIGIPLCWYVLWVALELAQVKGSKEVKGIQKIPTFEMARFHKCSVRKH